MNLGAGFDLRATPPSPRRFSPGLTSGLNRFGITWSFFLGELLGVVLIFAGFVVSTEVFASRIRVGRWTLLRREVAAG